MRAALWSGGEELLNISACFQSSGGGGRSASQSKYFSSWQWLCAWNLAFPWTFSRKIEGSWLRSGLQEGRIWSKVERSSGKFWAGQEERTHTKRGVLCHSVCLWVFLGCSVYLTGVTVMTVCCRQGQRSALEREWVCWWKDLLALSCLV